MEEWASWYCFNKKDDGTYEAEAFQHGFMAYYKDDNQWQVLPDKDFYQSLEAEGAEANEAVSEDGQRVGGDAETTERAARAERC